MKRDDWDIRIAAAVRSREDEVPDEVRARAIRRLGERKPARRPLRGWLQPLPWAAAAAVLAIMIASPRRPSPPAGTGRPPLRTEIHVAEKSLTIIWMTRDDFQLGSFLE